MKEDPIVAEVHKIRGKLAKECGHDVTKMSERHRRIFRQWKGKKVTAPFHPEWRAPHAAVVAESEEEYITKRNNP